MEKNSCLIYFINLPFYRVEIDFKLVYDEQRMESFNFFHKKLRRRSDAACCGMSRGKDTSYLYLRNCAISNQEVVIWEPFIVLVYSSVRNITSGSYIQLVYDDDL